MRNVYALKPLRLFLRSVDWSTDELVNRQNLAKESRDRAAGSKSDDKKQRTSRQHQHDHHQSKSEKLEDRAHSSAMSQLLRPMLGLRPWFAFERRALTFFFWVRLDMAVIVPANWQKNESAAQVAGYLCSTYGCMTDGAAEKSREYPIIFFRTSAESRRSLRSLTEFAFVEHRAEPLMGARRRRPPLRFSRRSRRGVLRRSRC